MTEDLLQAVRDWTRSVHGDAIRNQWDFHSDAPLSDAEVDGFIDRQSNTWLLSAIDTVGAL